MKLPHLFLEQFKLTPSIFTLKMNQVYNGKLSIYWVGGWPYFPPKRGLKIALNVCGLYENDDWVKDTWAVAYHAVFSPEAICPNNMTVL